MDAAIIEDHDVDKILEDWYERESESFVKIRKHGRLGWEKSLKEGEAYSSYLLEAPTKADLIRRAYSLARDMIAVMNPPMKVTVRITPNDTSCTDGKVVYTSTKVFDDLELDNGEKLDVFLGFAIHEGCHLLYTDFKITSKNKLCQFFTNVLEDERIEEILGEEKPGLANFLEKCKYYVFDQLYLGRAVSERPTTDLAAFCDIFLRIIRYPKYLNEDDIVKYGKFLLAVKEVVHPLPESTLECKRMGEKIYEIIVDLYKDDIEKTEADKIESLERKLSELKAAREAREADSDDGERGSSMEEIEKITKEKELEESLEKVLSAARMPTEGELRSEAIRKVAEESEKSEVTSMLKEYEPKTSVHTEDASAAVVAKGGLLGEECEGKVELGIGKDVFFSKEEDKKDAYTDSLNRVRKYIPAISRIMKGHCREYKLIHRSMRSGLLDTNKLAEAIQGVPTVYIREGEVHTDKIAVCILVDESGSMSSCSRYKAARDTAILLNEALQRVPNVTLFIYGHSGDERTGCSTDLKIYRERSFVPKYALGSIRARHQNRDGNAILETATRVRKQTKDPVLMFILSDGEPAASGYCGRSAIEHTKQCVEKAEKMGFSIVQICISATYNPALMFKHYIELTDMSTLAIELGKVVKKAAMSLAKVRID